VFKQYLRLLKTRRANELSVSDAELRRDAREIVEEKIGFYIHLATYAIVNSLIFLVWWYSGTYSTWTFPWNMWFVFPLAFWGAGVLVHYVCVFTPYSGIRYIERKTEQEYQKLKRNNEERREETATV
jgi:membrane protein implicated in regulation of membrane protease activity